jgi:endonuclease/exonuclease/phosphatase family metal-dependent hydrolase
MTRLIIKISFLFVLLIVLSIQGSTSLEQGNEIQPNQRQFKNEELSRNLSLNPDFGKIPLYFIPNEGQVEERALFYAKASRYTLWLTKEGIVFDSTRRIEKEDTKSKILNARDLNNSKDYKYDKDVSRLIFINTNTKADVIPLNDTEHKVNYFIGKDESKWRSNIQTSSAVLYNELYPNIALKVYGVEQQIEYDFVVRPGGQVSDIGLEYQDIEETRLDKEGNLVIKTKFGELEHAKPVCYQVIEGEKVKIKAKFERIENNTYGFKVEEYNRDYELIIDPLVLVYSTYLGGSEEDKGNSIAVDSEGAVYVAGYTSSTDFPTQNPIQAVYGGGSPDAFIAKIKASGGALIYSTYLGGSDGDGSFGIAVDSEGAVYMAGTTGSLDFPTQNPIQADHGGGSEDAFIAKINASGGKLIYSTYLGGSGNDWGNGIAVDSEGAVYVAGNTWSTNFPTQNPIQANHGGGSGDAFIAKINAPGGRLIYSTYLGGSDSDYSYDIKVDSEGTVYVMGNTWSINFPTRNPIQGGNAGLCDAFIAKINSSGNTLVYSTYLGGSEREWSNSMAVDSKGAIYVTGWTYSVDFPAKNPIQRNLAGLNDVFLVKLNSSGNSLVYSTYLGGSDYDGGDSITVDSEGVVYMAGNTWSAGFPTKNPIQGNYGGNQDAFVAAINTSGNALIYSTYLGGSDQGWGLGIARDSGGTVYVTGFTSSTDFPTKNPIQGHNAGSSDAFIAKIDSSEGIRIVSWNILDYPDSNEEPREEYFRSLLKQLDPDILVVQEMASAGGVDQFLKEVLNQKKPKLYKTAQFFDGPDTDNALFYKKAKIGLISCQQIPTSFRDVTEYKMKIKKGEGKGTKFKVYSVHFSEGAGAKKKRENEALTLRTYLDGLLPDELFLVCGSFNMMSSTEKAFKILTGNQVNNNGRLMDPIHKTGKWHDKSKHRPIHTESTRKSKFGGGTGGGLDDRFDMILISYGLEDNEKLKYSEGGCSIFGNDGKHLNKAINKPKNRIVSPDIADALYKASDHLPVIIEIVPQDES